MGYRIRSALLPSKTGRHLPLVHPHLDDAMRVRSCLLSVHFLKNLLSSEKVLSCQIHLNHEKNRENGDMTIPSWEGKQGEICFVLFFLDNSFLPEFSRPRDNSTHYLL